MTMRIAQWALGNVGKVAVEEVLKDPAMELVVCYTRPGDKTGVDVGELCGGAPIGLAAASTVEEIIAAKPDLVLYMPLMWDVDTMVLLLESGIDVISTANFITGLSYGKNEQARLHQAGVMKTDNSDPAGLIATAMSAVNAIPHVLSAKPGLVMAGDLPIIAAAGRVGQSG